MPQETDYLIEATEVAIAELQFVASSQARRHLQSAIAEDDGIDSDIEDKNWLTTLKELPWLQQPAPLKLTFALFVVGVALALSVPVKQVILYKLACQSLVQNTPGAVCDPIQVQELVTTYQMWENIIMPLVLIATTVQVCRMLDIYGRKFFIGLFSVCLFCGELLYYTVITHTKGMPIGWMLFASVVALCTGGSSGIGALCKAYITDITKPSERVPALGMVFVGLTLGLLVGPLLSSFLLSHARKRAGGALPGQSPTLDNAIPDLELVPFRASLLLMLILAIYVIFFLPESRSPVARSKSRSASIALASERPQVRSVSWFHHIIVLFRPLEILFYPKEFQTRDNRHRFGRDRAIVIGLCASETMVAVISTVQVMLSPQYCIYKFNWDSVTLSNSMFAGGVASTFVFMAVTPILFNRVLPYLGFRPKSASVDAIDILVIVTSMALYSICLLGQAFAPNTSSYIGVSVVQQMYAICAPTLAAAVVKYYPDSKTGELYGALSLAQGVATLVFPALFSQLFTFGVRHEKPQLPFFAIAILSGGIACGGLVMRRLSDNSEKESQETLLEGSL